MKTQLRLVVLLLGITAAEAFGNPITLMFSGIATGVFGTTPFTNQPFTITSQGETNAVFVTSGPIYNLPAVGAIIDVAGFAPALFSDPTLWTDPQGSGDIIFNDATLSAGLVGFTKLFAGLETYQFQTSIGPISGGFPFDPNIFETFQNIPTSVGLLSITMTSDNVFTAVVLPEPASPWLALTGLSVLFLFGRVRFWRPFATIASSRD